MPKSTEQNLTVSIDKSEADITNNKRLHSGYYIIEANYRQTWSIVTAELLVELWDIKEYNHLEISHKDVFYEIYLNSHRNCKMTREWIHYI